MSNQHFPTPRPGSKREIAMRVFRRELPKRKQMVESVWRKNTLAKIAEEANTTHFASVSFYNYEKQRAVHEGVTEDFGRSAIVSRLQDDEDAQRLKLMRLRQQAKTAKGPYCLINVKTHQATGYYATRKDAISCQIKDERVAEA